MESPQNIAAPPSNLSGTSASVPSTDFAPRTASPALSQQTAQSPENSENQPPLSQPSGATNPSQQSTEDEPNQQYEQQYYEESGLIPGFAKPMKEEVLLEWVAPSRPFKKHNRQYYTTVGGIAGLIGLILFFAGQVLPVAVVIAVVFTIYVMTSIPPGDIVHKLTTYGIRLEEELYYWEELGRFWIKEKYGKPVLYIEVARFPNRLTILLGDIPADSLTQVLSEVLLNEEPLPTSYEKAAKWLHEKIPIDLEA